MNLFGINFGKQSNISTPPAVKSFVADSAKVLKFYSTEMPSIIEKKNQEWVSYGERNDYPEELLKLLSNSNIHNSIVERKSLMISGKGFTVDSQPWKEYVKTAEVKNALPIAEFFRNAAGECDLDEVLRRSARDWEIFGAFALEVIWSKDFTKVAAINAIDCSLIRTGKPVDGEVKCYFYSENWKKPHQFKPVEIHAFDVNDKEHHRQLLYSRRVRSGVKCYGVPRYSGALRWISVDAMMAEFHQANLKNGFNPSMVVKFFRKPPTPEEEDYIIDGLNQEYQGNSNTGKVMVFFSDGKENAPDIAPVSTQGLDKQFIALADQSSSNVLSGHGVVSPELMGISVPGKLGTSDLINSNIIFEAFEIAPARDKVLNAFETLMEANGLNYKIGVEVIDVVSIANQAPGTTININPAANGH